MLKTPHPSQMKIILHNLASYIDVTVKTTARLFTGLLAVLVLSATPQSASADDASIVDVQISHVSERTYSISVTIAHADTGWDHYANRWDVLDEQGNVLGSRELAHPHVNEQPFTRSLRLDIPATVKTITIVAADSVHGDNEETVQAEVPLPQ